MESLLAHILAYRALVDIRDRVHHAFARLAPGYLIERRSGDLGATAIADLELLEVFFSHTLSPLAVTIVVPFSAAVALGFFHWSLPRVLLAHSSRSGAERAAVDALVTVGMLTVLNPWSPRCGLSTIRTADRLVVLDHGRFTATSSTPLLVCR